MNMDCIPKDNSLFSREVKDYSQKIKNILHAAYLKSVKPKSLWASAVDALHLAGRRIYSCNICEA